MNGYCAKLQMIAHFEHSDISNHDRISIWISSMSKQSHNWARVRRRWIPCSNSIPWTGHSSNVSLIYLRCHCHRQRHPHIRSQMGSYCRFTHSFFSFKLLIFAGHDTECDKAHKSRICCWANYHNINFRLHFALWDLIYAIDAIGDYEWFNANRVWSDMGREGGVSSSVTFRIINQMASETRTCLVGTPCTDDDGLWTQSLTHRQTNSRQYRWWRFHPIMQMGANVEKHRRCWNRSSTHHSIQW